MSEIIPVQYGFYEKNKFSKVIDTEFRELNSPQNIPSEVTIEDFFALYDQLFNQIPIEGDINSHRYILNREANYLGIHFADDVDVQALLQEITDLRQQLINLESVNSRLEDQLPLNELSALENQQLLSESAILTEDMLNNSILESQGDLAEAAASNAEDQVLETAATIKAASRITNNVQITNPNLLNNSI